MTLRGLPPFAPFARTAAVLASERTLPPFRPRATAARFLEGFDDVVGIGSSWVQYGPHRRRQGVQAVSGEVLIAGPVPFASGTSAECPLARPVRRVVAAGFAVRKQWLHRVLHAPIKPNRLGFVNPLKQAIKRAFWALGC